MLFALALYCSNRAYLYSSVARPHDSMRKADSMARIVASNHEMSGDDMKHAAACLTDHDL